MIDQHGLMVFEAMGYSPDNIPNTLDVLYTAAKKKKDAVYPGRMSPEMCAVIATFADVIDKRIDFTEPAEPKQTKPAKIPGNTVIGEK